MYQESPSHSDRMAEQSIVHAKMHHVELPQSILTGFILDTSESGTAEILPGGCNTCYIHRPSNAVLKPTNDTQETEILSNIVSQVDALGPHSHFQLSKPLQSSTGTFVYNGWSASTFIPDVRALDPDNGEYTLERLEVIIHASRAFHDALQKVQLSDHELDHLRHGVNHVWAQSHRMVWSGINDPQTLLAPFAPLASKDPSHRYVKLVRQLVEIGDTLGSAPAHHQHLYKTSPQIVHGDVVSGNNVLFPLSSLTTSTSPNNTNAFHPLPQPPPAMIDISPTLAPVAYAEGIILADTLVWCGLGLEILYVAGDPTPERLDMLRRGLMFRCLSDIGLAEGGLESAKVHVDLIESVVRVLVEFVKGRVGVGVNEGEVVVGGK